MKVSRKTKLWYSQREDVELPATDRVAWGNTETDPVIEELLMKLKKAVESGTAPGVPQDEESCLTQEFNQHVEYGMPQQLSQDIDPGMAQGLSEDSIDIFRLILFLVDTKDHVYMPNNS